MAQAMLEEILQQLPRLESEELLLLRQAVQNQLAPPEEASKRQIFYQSLLASGLVKQIKHRSRVTADEPPLVKIKGKPVSETIIEERG